MKEEDLKLFSHFLSYFQSETDRGAALVGAAMIDSKLERILDICLLDNKAKKDLLCGSNAPIGTFSAKINLCFALGFITPKEYEEINLIRKIRNEFAHKLEELSFSSQPICDFCLQLKADPPVDFKKEKNYRGMFVNSVVLTTMALWYRPEYIKRDKPIKLIDYEYHL